MNDVIEIIAEMRGGFPDKCDFCDEERPPEELVPDEAGEWSCVHCWKEWDKT